MEPTLRPRVKICCITTREEADVAIAHGAAALGLVAHMPSGPGVIPEREIAEIALRTPPPIGTFLLTSRTRVAGIAVHQKHCRTNTIQLCDRLVQGDYYDLKGELPGISIVQVVHVTGEESIDEAWRASEAGADAVLLDSGNPSLAVKELGGTGRTHDWNLSRRIREVVSVPVFLAGGLRPDNVAEAIRTVGPFGIDVCSGVRTAGRLDPVKLAAFFRAIETAYR